MKKPKPRMDDLIKKIQGEAVEKSKRLKPSRPMPQAPSELAPGYYINRESGMALASSRGKRRKPRRGGMT